MKVLYISNALTHYYNFVLNRLNSVEGIEVVVVVPREPGGTVGDAVHQTRDGVEFRVIELEEFSKFIYSSFRKLGKLISEEAPDVVVVGEPHLLTFLFNIPAVYQMRKLRSKLILKSIPFRTKTLEEAKYEIASGSASFTKIPGWMGSAFRKLKVDKSLKLARLRLTKIAFNRPDAHVNYTDDGQRVYGSFGVPPEKIFVTHNSPDTDRLFEIRKTLESADPLLPENPHRIIHVGRLVEWKRVGMLIRAVARLKKEYPGIELLVLGFGPLEQSLKDLADELGVSASVNFVGGVYEPEVLGSYLATSSIYVLAGMGGLSINDAMCFGLPVICSVCDGTEKYLVKEGFNGKYFEDGNEDDLVDKIDYLFSNPAKLAEMGENSTKIIRDEINIHTVIAGYTKAFNFVVDGNGVPELTRS